MNIAVTGGKGGTGKSTVAINIATILSKKYKVALVDADVECPNDHFLLSTNLKNEKKEYIFRPRFEYKKCVKCSLCVKNCAENAIVMFKEGYPFLIPTLCSGCKACQLVCHFDAIQNGQKEIGSTYLSKVNENLTIVTGVLKEGEEKSYPMVLFTKKRAEECGAEIKIFDTSAGTGNHVAAAIESADLVIAVTEPTPLGIHDIKMIMNLLSKQGKKGYVVINRSDLIPMDKSVIADYPIIGELPYSDLIVQCYLNGKSIVESYPECKESKIFESIIKKVMSWNLL